MRKSFIEFLCDKAKDDKKICLLTGDLGYSVLEPFENLYPERFFNIGVAEQNMVGIAAGLASEGFKPYTYSIGVFPTFRCAEQLRNDVDYHKLNVVTTTVGSGVAYGALGYTHHAVQDLAIMRSLPNTIIATPSDPIEVLSILEWHYENPCPLYLRMHKAGNPILHKEKLSLGIGKWINIHNPDINIKSKDVCILIIGSIAPKLKEITQKINPSIPIFTLPIWGQKYKETQIKNLENYRKVITVEDHLLDCGFGSWIQECSSLCEKPAEIIPLALPSDTVGKVAKENTLLEPLFKDFKNKLISF